MTKVEMILEKTEGLKALCKILAAAATREYSADREMQNTAVSAVLEAIGDARKLIGDTDEKDEQAAMLGLVEVIIDAGEVLGRLAISRDKPLADMD
jgi:hypothetical protein